VVAPHHLATEAGIAVLRAGGSAVDAAIATNAVLGVVMPNGCGIGGDAFWLIWDEATQTQHALNGSGRAPGAVDPVALRARALGAIPRRGPLSITVPGAVRSWGDAHGRFGRLTREAVLAPAIELAREGFPAWDGFVASVEATSVKLAAAARTWASGFFSVYRPEGRPWRRGERVRLPALASTLERLATDGFEAFYAGEIAERAARALAAAGSAIEVVDLAAHTSTWTTPIATDYRGVRVTTHPPNSCGIVALETLNVLERFEPPPPGAFGPTGCADPRWLHLGIEASKLAFVDRDAHVGDPEAAPVPTAHLLDKGYAAVLASRIDPDRADPAPPSVVTLVGGTIYVAVVDRDGNAVSLVQSNASGFGSGVVDPATGIHFHNRGQAFSLDPDDRGALAPGRRPRHSLLPGMLFRDGRPWVVAGSMGGDAQPQIHVQLVSALVDGRVDVASGVGAPRWFLEPAEHPAPPVEVRAEPRFAPGVLERLEAMGHPVTRTEPFDSLLGHCHAIELVGGGPATEGGALAAATDPRSAGLPAVY
jgi:gamma-glutamyltranspeptidase/glutathione hydrolase